MNHENAFNELVARLAALPEVTAIALGGSRATGAADPDSDYDLYVYLGAELPAERRKAACADLFRYMEWDNRYWETEDDGVFSDGVPVDIIYRSLDWAEGELRARLTEHRADAGYSTCMLFNLATSRVLHDPTGRLSALRDAAQGPYPEALRHAIVRKNHALLRGTLPAYRDQIAKALKRGDELSANHRVAAFFASWFDLMFAFNRLLHPGEKRMLELLAAKAQAMPEGTADVIAAVLSNLHADGLAALAALDRLCDATDRLLASEPELRQGR